MLETTFSITFEADSSLKRIETRAFSVTAFGWVVIPPTLCYIACDEFSGNCQISVFDCISCPELGQWCARHLSDSRWKRQRRTKRRRPNLTTGMLIAEHIVKFISTQPAIVDHASLSHSQLPLSGYLTRNLEQPSKEGGSSVSEKIAQDIFCDELRRREQKPAISALARFPKNIMKRFNVTVRSSQ